MYRRTLLSGVSALIGAYTSSSIGSNAAFAFGQRSNPLEILSRTETLFQIGDRIAILIATIMRESRRSSTPCPYDPSAIRLLIDRVRIVLSLLNRLGGQSAFISVSANPRPEDIEVTRNISIHEVFIEINNLRVGSSAPNAFVYWGRLKGMLLELVEQISFVRKIANSFSAFVSSGEVRIAFDSFDRAIGTTTFFGDSILGMVIPQSERDIDFVRQRVASIVNISRSFAFLLDEALTYDQTESRRPRCVTF